MKKEEIRKEFFKLKNNGFSYAQCRRILKAQFEYGITVRTLKRWSKKLDDGCWDLRDKSKRPHKIYYKIDLRTEQEVLALRNKTGWGSDKLAHYLPHLGISARSIDNILSKHSLLRTSKIKGKQKSGYDGKENILTVYGRLITPMSRTSLIATLFPLSMTVLGTA